MNPIKKYSGSIQRNYTVDLFRIIACFGVIFIHVHNSTYASELVSKYFSYFCVPYFYISALTYFSSSLSRGVKVRQIFLKVGKRIGLPFLAWSIIYAGLIIAKSLLIKGSFTINIPRTFLYGESAEHLYYLPELIIMEVIVLSIYLLAVVNKSVIGLLFLLIAFAYLIWGSWNKYYGITSCNSLIVYVAMSFFIIPQIYKNSRDWRYLMVGFILILFTLSNNYFSYPDIIKIYLSSIPAGGIGIFLIALNLPNLKLPYQLSVVALATYGIYLSHILFVEAFEMAFDVLHYNFTYNLFNKMLFALVTLTFCVIFVLIIRKNKYTRLILLGED